ncbi:MAG: hypothetical protein RIB52_05405 [Erythrobacter sp.]|uniref:hypothetical protein n=1 Tax=Erythrobacter sp. TaxID=1042 RepID=UPI0032EB7BC8
MDLARLLPDRDSRLVRWGGNVLLVLALAYCGFAIARLGMDEVLANLPPAAWGIALGTGAAYGLALALLALGWGAMAHGRGNAHLGVAEGLAVYAPGVIAKYIPGSVFQYGSRQLLGSRFGLSQGAMVRASLVEAGLHVPAALICAAVLLAGAGAAGLAAFIVLGAALAVLGPGSLARAAGCQLAFFALFALFVALLAGIALGMGDPLRLAGIFMLAWVAGFLVPVAPGGLGVRESVLLALSAQVEPSGAAIAAFALLTRFATSLGDAGFGIAGYGLLFTRSKRQASS